MNSDQLPNMDELLAIPPFSLRQSEKEAMLLPELNRLTDFHIQHCVPYRKIMSLLTENTCAWNLASVPFLPVGIFKSQWMTSVPEDQIYRVLTSSGTTGQRVSRIALDKPSALLQSKALTRVMAHVLGTQRLPMLIVDSKSVLTNKQQPSARAAAVIGMMNFGRAHAFALDDKLNLDLTCIKQFLQDIGSTPFLIFGFTFILWSCLLLHLESSQFDFSQATLIHGGGWKRMTDIAVDNAAFKAAFRDKTDLRRCFNFYGMAEQIGSVFLEGEDGLLHPPAFADVIVRDPVSWNEVPNGTPGLIQVLSLLPRCYPGHSLLTEDIGVVDTVDSGMDGSFGKALRVLGRLPRAELRGCSDTAA